MTRCHPPRLSSIRRLPAALGILLLLALSGCGDHFFSEGDGGAPASMELQFLLSDPAPSPSEVLTQEIAGSSAVFRQVDGVRIQLAGGGEVLLDDVIDVDGDDEEIRVRVELDLEDTELQVELDIDLLVSGTAVFTGGDAFVLRQGQTARAEVELVPVAGGIQLDPPPPPFDALGATAQLSGEALFPTGDVIPDSELTWSSLDPDVLQVESGGLATAVAPGTGRAQARFRDFIETVSLEVAPIVVEVRVSPSAPSLEAGEALQLQATALDRLENPVPGEALEWFSLDADIAEVTQEGEVSGRRPGTTTVGARAAGEEGTVEVTVTASPPLVEPLDALGIEAESARLRASVNPRGLPTSVRFRYATNSSLEEATLTPVIDLPAGASPTTVGQNVEGLSPGTTYYFRAEAESEAGAAEGPVGSFSTGIIVPPPSTPFVQWRAGQVDMGWEYGQLGGVSFQVERGMVADGSPPVSYTQVGTTSEPNFQDVPPEPGETWAYRIRACEQGSCSEPSMPDSAYVPRDVVYGFVTNMADEPVASASGLIGAPDESNTTSIFSDATGYFEVIADFNLSFEFSPVGEWFYDMSASDGFAFGTFEVTPGPFMFRLDIQLDPSEGTATVPGGP